MCTAWSYRRQGFVRRRKMIREPKVICAEKTLTATEQKGTYVQFGSAFSMGDSAKTIIPESKKAFVKDSVKMAVYVTADANSACDVVLYGKDTSTGTERKLATYSIPLTDMVKGYVFEANISDFAPRFMMASVKGTTSLDGGTTMKGKVRVEVLV